MKGAWRWDGTGGMRRDLMSIPALHMFYVLCAVPLNGASLLCSSDGSQDESQKSSVSGKKDVGYTVYTSYA